MAIAMDALPQRNGELLRFLVDVTHYQNAVMAPDDIELEMGSIDGTSLGIGPISGDLELRPDGTATITVIHHTFIPDVALEYAPGYATNEALSDAELEALVVPGKSIFLLNEAGTELELPIVGCATTPGRDFAMCVDPTPANATANYNFWNAVANGQQVLFVLGDSGPDGIYVPPPPAPDMSPATRLASVMGGTAAHATRNAIVEFRFGGADPWHIATGAASFGVAEAEVPTVERRDFGGVHEVVGRAGRPRITIAFPNLLVTHPVYRGLDSARRNASGGETVECRLRLAERTVVQRVPGRTVRIDAEGRTEFLPAPPDLRSRSIAEGMSVETAGGRLHEITAIDRAANLLAVAPPGGAVDAGPYRIVLPAIGYGPVTCIVQRFAEPVVDPESGLGTSLHMIQTSTSSVSMGVASWG